MKYECIECRPENCMTEMLDHVGAPKYCLYYAEKIARWLPVIEPAPKPLSSAILPKLTAAVFDREDCPEWVNYLGVNKNGTATGFRDTPDVSNDWWACKTHSPIPYPIEKLGIFDPTDWQNSLIKRPEKKKLPDWCKVGAWVWDTRFGVIVEVDAIDSTAKVKFIGLDCALWARVDNLKPARVRPWTFEEAPLDLKLNYKGEQATAFLTSHNKLGWCYVVDKDGRTTLVTMEEIAEHGVQLSGSPCGVLEVAEVGK